MKKFYSGKYKVANPEKYKGDIKNVVYRSMWERQVFKFLDSNASVIAWSSEEIRIPYICKTDNRAHLYHVDILVKFANNATYLIEIKPKWETLPPPIPKRQTKRYREACMTYLKNMSKWEAAHEWAKKKGIIFEVWTEDTLKSLGIKII